MAGNDGTQYKSVPDKRGIHTWKKLNSTRKATTSKVNGKAYKIHDNGNRPFTVVDNKKEKRVTIFNVEMTPKPELVKLKEFKYLSFWPGSPVSNSFGDWEPGNTVVIQKDKSNYVFVNREVQEFQLEKGDEVVTYMSPIGNNDVPYPYIIGKTYVYLLLEAATLPKESLDLKQDVYAQYYGINEFKGAGLKKIAKKLKMK